MSLFFVS